MITTSFSFDPDPARPEHPDLDHAGEHGPTGAAPPPVAGPVVDHLLHECTDHDPRPGGPWHRSARDDPGGAGSVTAVAVTVAVLATAAAATTVAASAAGVPHAFADVAPGLPGLARPGTRVRATAAELAGAAHEQSGGAAGEEATGPGRSLQGRGVAGAGGAAATLAPVTAIATGAVPMTVMPAIVPMAVP